eukprot:3411677-Pleurochrysis_carterae.AAC.1
MVVSGAQIQLGLNHLHEDADRHELERGRRATSRHHRGTHNIGGQCLYALAVRRRSELVENGQVEEKEVMPHSVPFHIR